MTEKDDVASLQAMRHESDLKLNVYTTHHKY